MQSLIADGSVSGGTGRHDPGSGDRLSSYGHELDHRLTVHGSERLQTLGVEFEPDTALRYCVDWTEQAHHLSGALGKALTARMLELRWLRRADRGRAVHVTREGRRGLGEAFGIAP